MLCKSEVINNECGFSFRGLFVIDKTGTLRQMTINDLPVGRDVDETLRLVQVNHHLSQELKIQNNVFQAFQFTDEHGEVCPAGWRPGEKNILCELELGFGKIAH